VTPIIVFLSLVFSLPPPRPRTLSMNLIKISQPVLNSITSVRDEEPKYSAKVILSVMKRKSLRGPDGEAVRKKTREGELARYKPYVEILASFNRGL